MHAPEVGAVLVRLRGQLAGLDQILVSDNLEQHPIEYDVVHVNAEFADQVSDHDPQVARIDFRGRERP